MTITEKILSGIKQAITEGGKVNIDLKEASAITGSGSGVGAWSTERLPGPWVPTPWLPVLR